MAVFGYLRCKDPENSSTDQQYFIARASEHGIEVADENVLVDATASCNRFSQRRAAQILFTVVGQGDVVVFASLENGFVALRDFLDVVTIFKSRNVTCIVLDFDGYVLDLSTQVGQLVLWILSVAYRWTAHVYRDRGRRAFANRTTFDKYSQRPPIGWRWKSERDGSTSLVPDEPTREQIDLFNTDLDTGMTLNDVWRERCLGRKRMRRQSTSRRRITERGVRKYKVEIEKSDWNPVAIDRAIKALREGYPT